MNFGEEKITLKTGHRARFNFLADNALGAQTTMFEHWLHFWVSAAPLAIKLS